MKTPLWSLFTTQMCMKVPFWSLFTTQMCMKAPFWSLFMCAVVMQPLPVLFEFVVADAGVCSDSPCRNGGTCIPGVGTYTCQCMFGYLGDHCEQGLWLSSSNLCLSLLHLIMLIIFVCGIVMFIGVCSIAKTGC